MIIEIYFHHLVTRRLWKCSQIYVNLPQLKPQYQWQTQQWMSMPVTTDSWYPCSMISSELQLLQKATSFQNIIITKKGTKKKWLNTCKWLQVTKCFTISNRCTYLLVSESTKIYIKIYTKLLLHVSVYDHYQGACTWA
jgi:hypothetical protein